MNMHRKSITVPAVATRRWQHAESRSALVFSLAQRCRHSANFNDRLDACRLPCSGCQGEGKRAFENNILLQFGALRRADRGLLLNIDLRPGPLLFRLHPGFLRHLLPALDLVGHTFARGVWRVGDGLQALLAKPYPHIW